MLSNKREKRMGRSIYSRQCFSRTRCQRPRLLTLGFIVVLTFTCLEVEWSSWSFINMRPQWQHGIALLVAEQALDKSRETITRGGQSPLEEHPTDIILRARMAIATPQLQPRARAQAHHPSTSNRILQSFSRSFGAGSPMPSSLMANIQSDSGKQGES